MSEPVVTDSLQLFNSLSLEERISLLGKVDKSQQTSTNEEFYAQWKRNFFGNQEKFFQRLALINTNDEEFKKAISQEPTSLPDAAAEALKKSDWYSVLEEGFKLLDMKILTSAPKTLSVALFPFLMWAERQWNQFFSTISHNGKALIHEEELLNSLKVALVKELMTFALPSLVLEVNVARLLNQIEGETPEQRFESFVIKKLQSSAYLRDFYEEYAVLAKILATRTKYMVHNTIEALKRFLSDYEEINQIISIEQDPLCQIEIGLGDKHQKGNSVMRFQFKSNKELMYKPKSLAITEKFQSLLKWFHAKGLKRDFKYYKILDKNHYAWEQVIDYLSCEHVEQVKAFYYRYGALVGITYLLKGIDFHYENLIANGEHPVLIDLETLFHNNPILSIPNTAEENSKYALADTVLGTNLLPLFLYQTENSKGIEFSGLGGEEQTIPFDVKQLVDFNTDQMRFCKKSAKLKPANNRPMLNGEIANFQDFTDDILCGFTDALKIAIRFKQELLAKDGPVYAFEKVPIRMIVRSTQKYTNLITELNHPDFQRNFLDREKNLDVIWSYPIENLNVIHSEYNDLLIGDVPFFLSTPNSLDLIDSQGKTISNVFRKSSFTQVIERIEGLTEEKMNYQLKLINGSFLSILKDSDAQTTLNDSTLEAAPLTREKLLEEATKIGQYLKEIAVFGDDDATWIGLNLSKNGAWQITNLPVDFYEGVSGISLFLGHLYKYTGDLAFKDLSEKAMQTGLNYLRFLEKEQSISSFYGVSSLLYPLIQLKKIGIATEPMEEALELIIRHVKTHIERDQIFDYISGSSGVLTALLSLYELEKREDLLAVCCEIADHLLKNMTARGDSLVWSSSLHNHAQPLGGFAHGVSGISFALAKLGKITQKNNYIHFAQQALKYEEELFDDAAKQWLDARKPERTPCEAYWCNGHTGIAMNRLFFAEHIDKDLYRNQLSYAVEQIFARPIYENHSLCHGAVGVADFLLEAGFALNDERLLQESRAIIANVLYQKEQQGCFASGAPKRAETLGLFLGLSGIGYQLLRFYQPQEVPSLLYLA